ncbi:MAG: ATP-binding protein [Brumimicrobium sp.]|nr:ATP-binding protein [Brumimicrobium sp.]
MKRQTAIFFYVLGAYVLLQFIWWGYHLIELSGELSDEEGTSRNRILMIVGEGTVFLLIMLLGLWKIRSSIIKDLKLSERQSNFLLSVTHELKTPLASNKLYLQTLLKRNELNREQQEDLLNQAITENKRLEDMIENILTATRIENRRLKLNYETVRLDEHLKRIASEWSRERTTITFDIEENIEAKVDLFVVQVILTNLLDNAFKYGGPEPQITVYLHKKDRQLVWGVKDQGIGIPTKFKSSVFDKFVRIGNEETRIQKGTGLGLYIVKELLRIHGGKISYLPNEPRGSHFKITFNHGK